MKEGRNNNLYKTSGVSAVWLLSVQMFLLCLTTGKASWAKDRFKSPGRGSIRPLPSPPSPRCTTVGVWICVYVWGFFFFFCSFFSLAGVAHNAPLWVTDKMIKIGGLLTSLNWTWSEGSNFETVVLACMVKPKFGPFSRVAEMIDWLTWLTCVKLPRAMV